MTEAMQIRSARRSEITEDGEKEKEIETPTRKPRPVMKKNEKFKNAVVALNNRLENAKGSPSHKDKIIAEGGRRKSDINKEDKITKQVTEGRKKSGDGNTPSKLSSESTRRGSTGRPQIKIPYLAQIERRISMDLLDYSGKLEGLKLIRELNRETSNYRQLVVYLGGSSDCEQLRDDLKKSRQRSADLVKQAKLKILPCLQEPNRFSNSDRKEAKRLCKLLFYCIRVLEQELIRSLALQNTFVLNVGNQNLINTGVNEYFSVHKSSPPAIGNDQALKEKLNAEKNDLLSLQKESSELRTYMHKSDGSPGVKSWTMEDFGERQFLHTILEDSDPSSVSSPASPFQNLESNNSDQESVAESIRVKLHHRRCLCWIFVSLITTLLLASLLGALISFLAS